MIISERDSLKTGIPLIDKQHEEYADLVDRFFEMASKGNVEREELSWAVDQVVKYAVEHFDAEEQLMRSVDYPYYDEHRAKHNIFRAETDDYALFVTESVDIDVCAITASKWLINWFCDQVQCDDLKLARFLRSMK